MSTSTTTLPGLFKEVYMNTNIVNNLILLATSLDKEHHALETMGYRNNNIYYSFTYTGSYVQILDRNVIIANITSP